MDAAVPTASDAGLTELPNAPAATATTATDTSADGELLAPLDVTDEELSGCIAVLEKFHTPNGLAHFQSPKFKSLRTALMPMLAEVRKKFFHGKSADDDEKRQEKKRKIKVERARQKALDQQFINNTALRAERLARLATLTAANPLLAHVPDGAVSSHRLLTVEANVEMVDSAETTAPATNGDSDATELKPVAGPELHHHRSCYTCKLKFKQLHHFYDQLCPSCAALNYEKRLQTADLKDHVAIITGARVKIGYEITLKLLRAGATVVATTRFPKDAAFRFAKEPDFDDWKHRLQVYGMDFRDLGVIDKFMDHVEKTFGTLDILVNNATQTIRRPVHYYKHLISSEVAPIPEEFAQAEQILRGNANLLGLTANASSSSLPTAEPKASGATVGAIVSASGRASAVATTSTSAATPSSVLLSQVVLVSEDEQSKDTSHLFPQGQVDINNQQVDLRTSNSWVQKIDQIETMELVEVFAINTMAPFILNKRAIPLLEKSKNKQRFIINVSAMEGKFYRAKSPHHPHTNMAKAAANMMTRTAAEDLAKRGIYMNSGWINDENPREAAARIAKMHNFQTPLDEVDAAARVLDPIFVLHQEKNHDAPPMFGQFLKDFKVSEW